ncbi:MAG: hypothetical protein KatS3mg085_324 [Candidatus Dojkabacteria bacterium]|nr:MAG: hypothetical protein KatS3mg085_324 [Candidatus Dojkabacteria bacterium]
MRKKIFFLKLKLNQIFKNIELDGIALTFILFLFSIILFLQIISVVNRAKYNYDVYVYEKNTLSELKSKLEETIDELDYVSSEEYQTLLLRDAYSFASDRQILFRENNVSSVATINEKEYLKIDDTKEFYTVWWKDLIF